MSCATGTPLGWQAADSIAARLTGAKPRRTSLAYSGQCISLGRKDGLVQWVTPDDRAKESSLRGASAARLKDFVCAFAAWSAAHPTLGMPTRRRRVAPTVAAFKTLARQRMEYD